MTLFDATKADALRGAVCKDTALVWIESPTNPNWDIIDIAEAAEIAHNVGALLAVDCTVSPPVTTDALGLGADIAFQSATKYLNGHSDITGGVLSLAQEGALFEELSLVRILQGSIMAPFDA
ncbi:MAG: PLP-dependent transferase [Marinosulfonomonas sp.]|nr:PLP-dependent transferase [Marinosulfonomonas sp.]